MKLPLAHCNDDVILFSGSSQRFFGKEREWRAYDSQDKKFIVEITAACMSCFLCFFTFV